MHLFFAVLLALTQQWLVVSDLHVEPGQSAPPAAYGTDSDWELFDSIVARMRRAEPNPAVVVIAGDFLAHHFASAVRAEKLHENASQAGQAVMGRIERSFASAFPRAQFIITMGNNDDPCGDYSTAPNSPYLREVARIWQPLVDRNNAAPDFARQFARAGYYTAQLPGGVRAIVLNSVFWSVVFHPCGPPVNTGNEQLVWLSQKLAERKPSMLLMHMPPGVDATSTLITHRFIVVPFLQGAVEGRLSRILSAHQEDVRFIIVGHTHFADVREAGGVPLLIAPAISPIYDSNPSFLRLQVDEHNVIRDLQSYSYDLDGGDWLAPVDFDREFGVKDLRLDQIHALHGRIADDLQLRRDWASWMVGMSRSTKMNSGNWRAFWCAQTLTGAAYVSCAGDQRRVALLPFVILVIVLVLIAAVTLLLRRALQRRRA